VLIALTAIPLVAAVLYLIGGHPGMPAAPLAERLAKAERADHQATVLINTLKQRLAQLDPRSDTARQGYVLLGNVEDSMGHLAEAAAAWRKAVVIHFDPMLAAQAAEAQTRVDGHLSDDSAALFRRALAAAPADAPWRALVEQRLAEAGAGPTPRTP
jgi:cytochrome c-type biogenesis protein CcmH